MYSVVDIQGNQIKVGVGDKVRVNTLPAEVKKELNFDRVLLFSDGKEVTVGRPTVGNAKVKARVLSHGKGKKIFVFKKKRRKDYKKKTGHRQGFTELLITEISFGGKKETYSEAAKKSPAKAKPAAPASFCALFRSSLA